MALATQKFEFTGISPLLMHNGQLADPLNDFAKEMKSVSGKRGKTDEDHEELARLEWRGSLYTDDDGAPVLSSALVEAALIQGAKKRKLGPVFKAGVLVLDDAKLKYDGPKDIKKLWEDAAYRLRVGVKVQQNRVMRTRPQFPKWSAVVEVQYDTEQVDQRTLIEVAETTGALVGLGDWRPKFGRFTVKAV